MLHIVAVPARKHRDTQNAVCWIGGIAKCSPCLTSEVSSTAYWAVS
jgi:hypothetical protein